MDIRVLTFSECAVENVSKQPIPDGESHSPLLHQTYEIEVAYERPKLYQKHPKTLAERIRKKRIESGLTQKEFGVILNVAECTVYNWERGIGPRGRLRTRLLAHMGVLPMSKNTEPGS